MEWSEAVWLGVPESEKYRLKIWQGDMNGRFVYYRCEVELKEKSTAVINITANSRYRLWVNEQPVLSGPCKGDRYRQYYENVDITEHLKRGFNVLAVQVLFCDPNAVAYQYQERAPIFAAATLPVGHLLAVEGVAVSGNETVELTTGKAPWQIYLDGCSYLKSDEVVMNLGAVIEEIDFRNQPPEWKAEKADCSSWAKPHIWGTVKADTFSEKVGLYGAFRIREREIPLLYEEVQQFKSTDLFEELTEQGYMVIEANSSLEIILDAGVHTNAYLKYQFADGMGAKVSITYSEKYSLAGSEIKRTDQKNGELKGLTDEIILAGRKLVYEPFWVRTFRFIRIRIQAQAQEVRFYLPKMRRTGYPLLIESDLKSSEPWVKRLWKMCLRTLQNCMMETYMDCPFYEQMQFVMDTRLQALFTYAVSSDVRLVKKALEDFHCSMIPDGLIQGKYPSAFPQIISTFSLHYIYMLEEYYCQTKDMALLKRYQVDIDAILAYYDSRIGERKLVEHLGYWQFVDWQDAWKENMGVPTAALCGPSTIINLMYAYALKCGAYINEVTGRTGMAKEYLERQHTILKQIQELCWDEVKGLYKEGPDFEEYSQHAQAWAILNGMVTKSKGREILKRTVNDSQVLQCSFSTGYELFRAFEWAEEYKETQILMEKWKRLIDWECSTCPEEPENGRSECHAWSALPIFELSRSVAGIKMLGTAWESVLIHPHLEYINDIKGSVVTPKGQIKFDFNKGTGRYQVCMPEGLSGEFILPDGSRQFIKDGTTVINS